MAAGEATVEVEAEIVEVELESTRSLVDVTSLRRVRHQAEGCNKSPPLQPVRHRQAGALPTPA